MTLQLGDVAPDFNADTSEGRIDFHDWLGDSWAVLFSHPKDFTPICTTELGYVAKIKPEFDRRGVKVIGLSVDSSERHEKWADDIEKTQGTRPNFPMISDTDFNVSKLYGMLPASAAGTYSGPSRYRWVTRPCPDGSGLLTRRSVVPNALDRSPREPATLIRRVVA